MWKNTQFVYRRMFKKEYLNIWINFAEDGVGGKFGEDALYATWQKNPTNMNSIIPTTLNIPLMWSTKDYSDEPILGSLTEIREIQELWKVESGSLRPAAILNWIWKLWIFPNSCVIRIRSWNQRFTWWTCAEKRRFSTHFIALSCRSCAS